MRKKIAIAGIGLIGGSLALDLKQNDESIHIIGVEKDEEAAQKALSLGLVDEISNLREAVAAAEIVILAAPPDVSVALLKQLLPYVTDQVIVDVSSVKEPMIQAASGSSNRGRYVAAHPMAGTEHSGPGAAQHGLFCRKACILCDTENSDEDAVSTATHLFQRLGMRILHMEAQAHDRHAAYVSHISHITSFALALTVLEKEKDDRNIFNLASGGFDSTVRLAKSEASMWSPVFSLNRKNMLDVIRSYEYQLSRFREAIENDDNVSVESLIRHSNTIKKALKQI